MVKVKKHGDELTECACALCGEKDERELTKLSTHHHNPLSLHKRGGNRGVVKLENTSQHLT
jgi:hypothetical protein